MSMHVVLGDGDMSRREITETLSDLWKKDEEAGNTFWFLVQAKSEPTAADQAIVKWLTTNSIYFETITDDPDSVSDIYAEAQETHVAKRLGQKIVGLMNTKPEEGESAELLALFFSDDSSAEEDQWLNRVAQDVFDAGFTVRALNDGLLEVDLSAEATEAEAEPEEQQDAKVLPIKKAVAKKAAAAPRRDTQVSEADETPEEDAAASSTHTREELEEMDLDGLKAVAAAAGITLPPRTRATTYIDAILGEDRPAVEVTPVESDEASTVASTNGQPHVVATVLDDVDLDSLADAITDKIIQRLADALSS